MTSSGKTIGQRRDNAIHHVTEENEDAVFKALNETNASIKVIKAYTPVPYAVWVGFEVLLDSTPVLDDIVPRGINMLRAAQQKFYESLQNV